MIIIMQSLLAEMHATTKKRFSLNLGTRDINNKLDIRAHIFQGRNPAELLLSNSGQVPEYLSHS